VQFHPNHQLQVLGSPFFRNKGAYVVGREINGIDQRAFVIPILRDEKSQIYVDALLREIGDIAILFSFSRAYFMVNMEVPSAYVAFLHSILPRKPVQELYSMLGLHKQSKTIFYRNLDHHLKYSSDKFKIAPGIKGMVMLVFTLPSFPFVFKVIKDVFEPPKEGNKELVKDRYLLVKHHDRVGRLADTLEYSYVALPKDRMEQDLIDELVARVPSTIEISGNRVLIKHVYIERRMIPLNDYMAHANERQRRHAIREYGDAIRDLAGANIFPGDMMLKNFGVTRHNRVVFYDYDEICYMTECNFRQIPPAPPGFDEMSSVPWYSVGPHDVFPEQFSAFFFSDSETRRIFYTDHRCLIDPEYWNDIKQQIQDGQQLDVFPYRESLRFSVGYTLLPALGTPTGDDSTVDCE
jgi:isocitrate dehydrogenase kinase/phosphatase